MSMWYNLLEPGPRYSGLKTFVLIVISVFITGSCALGTFLFFDYFPCGTFRQNSFYIQKIVQAGSSFQGLKTAFFAEHLRLSVDAPTPFHSFDCRKAEQTLLKTALFKEVYVKKMKPHTVFIHYTLRTPLAYFGDYANTVLDEEGVLFPLLPFFTPKKIPVIRIGEEMETTTLWGKKISEEKMHLIKALFAQLPVAGVREIDLSAIHSSSAGKRQLVLTIEQQGHLHYVRLTPKDYTQEIQNYFRVLNECLREQKSSCIVDLRLPQVAYLSFGEHI